MKRHATRFLVASTAVLALASTAAGQLTDLQPGRNFPTAVTAFGAGRSENLDVGDVDHDGDLDVVVANGGDGSAALNVLYLNDGNAQGGTQGQFTDATATRFAGLPADTSRDIELVDLDGDTDLDVFVANRGLGLANGGEVSRAYRNEGGAQQGSVGWFTESTDDFWGTLVAVPSAQEEAPIDGQGPFRDWSCDCEFGDLDGDGDLDLFHSTYGPNVIGTYDSRIFLNDGAGRFDELWPWTGAAADIALHTFDVDIADLDGDFDLDVVAASRDSQGRIYRNNFAANGWDGIPFSDVTNPALLQTGATLVGSANYAAELGDLDADGDFDLWMVNYDWFADVPLRNQGDLTFVATQTYVGDPDQDEREADFLDFDGDGDLDVFMANFSGTNSIVQSGLADGLLPGQGIYHRTGTATTLAPWPEAPETGNSGTTLDGECADMDGDGDPDILLANDNLQPNRYWENVLGVPDTHAPTFFQVTGQADKSDGSDTVLMAQVRDNASIYVVAFYRTDLVYTVDGGPETCVPMSSMGGMQFRGVIPGGVDGAITYRVECTDDAGNTGVSATFAYRQTSSGAPLWQNLGCGTEGSKGVPALSLSGDQVGGQPVELALVDAHADSLFLLWLAFAPTPAPAVGGTVYAFPFDVQVLGTTDAGGMRFASANWPPGVVPGTEATWQCVILDPTSPHGLTLSNAVRSIAP